MSKRCGQCINCQKIEKVKISVLRCCNPPFSHADNDVIEVWNDSLKRYPCMENKSGLMSLAAKTAWNGPQKI